MAELNELPPLDNYGYNPCFCELAPLEALGVLTEDEQAWIASQIAAMPELAEELADYQVAVNAIPYSAPEVPMAKDLKQRLFQNLNLELEPTESTLWPPSPAPMGAVFALRSQEFEWVPYRVPGVTIARLRVDEVSREVSVVLRAEPGISYPLHVHSGFEEIYMLQGDLIVGDQVYYAGDYIRSECGSSHGPSTQTGCMFFARTSLDDEYLEDSLVSA